MICHNELLNYPLQVWTLRPIISGNCGCAAHNDWNLKGLESLESGQMERLSLWTPYAIIIWSHLTVSKALIFLIHKHTHLFILCKQQYFACCKSNSMHYIFRHINQTPILNIKDKIITFSCVFPDKVGTSTMPPRIAWKKFKNQINWPKYIYPKIKIKISKERRR